MTSLCTSWRCLCHYRTEAAAPEAFDTNDVTGEWTSNPRRMTSWQQPRYRPLFHTERLWYPPTSQTRLSYGVTVMMGKWSSPINIWHTSDLSRLDWWKLLPAVFNEEDLKTHSLGSVPAAGVPCRFS